MAMNFRLIGDAVRTTLRLLDRLSGPRAGSSRTPPASRSPRRPDRVPPGGKPAGAPGAAARYPGDFHGPSSVRYAPSPNGLPEPGEVVWTWVPYEEDHSRGKDRPVLLVGHSAGHLLGVMLTSKDHDGDARASGNYVDIGTGAWDRQRRASEAKLDRILQINPADVRREGAILDAGRFGAVAAALRARHGWS